MSVQEHKDVVRRLADIVNSGAFDRLEEVFTRDYVRHDPNPLLADVGIEEYRQAFTRLQTAFPDAHWTLLELVGEGDRVAARWSFKGTQNGPFFSIPPTGRVVEYPILVIYRFEDGKIAEDWHIFHAVGLWQTLIPEVRELIGRATI